MSGGFDNQSGRAPLFSIITVTYNAAATLERTMRSVAAQDCDDYEHIIMDGVSTDNTVSMAETLAGKRTRIFSSPDEGIYDAMNKAMSHARGRYLIFLNAGDKFHAKDTLSIVARAAEATPDASVIYGQTDLVDDSGKYLGPRHLTAPEVLTVASFKHGMLVCHQAFIVRRDIAPHYDTRWRYSADYEWCLKCLKRSSENVYVDCTLIDYLAEGMTTANHRASLVERFKIMSKYYGFLPTVWRHAGFWLRNRRRRRAGAANIQ